MFFFAGHGLQVAGQNYLMPIDAELSTASALDFEMVRLDLVHRTMEREAPTNILFLDACRDNPLARNLARAMGTRSTEVGRGLAAVESGVGTLISFSTQPGNVALDGKGRNSPFAGSLAKHILSSSDDVSAVLIAVRNDVMKDTQNKQVPWEHSALRGRFFFNQVVQTSTSTPAPLPRLSEVAEAWDRTKGTNSTLSLEAFIRRFGDTYYGDLAKERLNELKRADAEQAAKAVKEKAVKAEAERQRLILLQLEQERRRAEEVKKAETKQVASLEPESEQRKLSGQPATPENKKADPKSDATKCGPKARSTWKRVAGYGALAVGANSCGYSWGAANKVQAEWAAMDHCRKRSTDCKIVEYSH